MEIIASLRTIQSLSRRRFIQSATMGMAAAAFAISEPEGTAAATKDSGEVVLDAVLITYIGAPLGTTGSAVWTPNLPYTTTLGLRPLANSNIKLRASVSPDQERISSPAVVKQAVSEKVDRAIKLFARPRENELFSIGTPIPGTPENTVFYGLLKPVLRFKGNAKKAQFRFVEAQASFSFIVEDIGSAFSEETGNSLASQYLFNGADLVEPRFVRVHTTDGGQIFLERKAERQAPEDITATATARIIEQNGFTSDVLKEAFAVGSNLEITYYSAEESKGKITTLHANLDRVSPGTNEIYWDRVFKTFVIVDQTA